MCHSYHATILLLLCRLPHPVSSLLGPTALPLFSASLSRGPTTTTSFQHRVPRGWKDANVVQRRSLSNDAVEEKRRSDGAATTMGHATEQEETARQRRVEFGAALAGGCCAMVVLAPWSALAIPSPVASVPASRVVASSTPRSIPAASTSEVRAPSFLDDHRSLLIAATTVDDASPASDDGNALNEVWTLVDKYYVNKASNRDWDRIRDDYLPRFESLAARSAPVDEQLKVVEEMVATLGDKYSRILTPSQYAEIQKFDLLGVGVTLMPSQGRIVVGAPPIEGSASARAGLQAGDVILKVDGVPTEGRTALDIIDQISEHPDARTLTFLVADRDATSANSDSDVGGSGSGGYEVTLDRTLMDVRNPIQYQLNDGDVGYVRISEFNSLVLPKLEEALAELSPSARRGLVLDLRHNTGGAFQSAVEIASRFLTDKVAIYVVDNTEQTTPFRTSSSPTSARFDPNVPVVIWMDGRTASASEVLAAALHDNCRAVLTGSNSFGKGLIQAVYGLKNGGGLVLTVARYVTPSGSDIQGTGIVPDVPGHVAPTLLGVPVSADTSSVDWTDVRRRLSQCQAPTP